ncbi:hypothetical protein BCR43DRAFT_495275 [Syncephalastrum racemosum]|uniref:Uncharacterized protein n=1 Tax=Syncephalastrum racemosum TaxID=13706 RepID=A0A1X2H5M8_SYNRA|nr:hypothetical protein BCR43DRAFT_495275 [Syncephalastrum racemosum]
MPADILSEQIRLPPTPTVEKPPGRARRSSMMERSNKKVSRIPTTTTSTLLPRAQTDNSNRLANGRRRSMAPTTLTTKPAAPEPSQTSPSKTSRFNIMIRRPSKSSSTATNSSHGSQKRDDHEANKPSPMSRRQSLTRATASSLAKVVPFGHNRSSSSSDLIGRASAALSDSSTSNSSSNSNSSKGSTSHRRNSMMSLSPPEVLQRPTSRPSVSTKGSHRWSSFGGFLRPSHSSSSSSTNSSATATASTPLRRRKASMTTAPLGPAEASKMTKKSSNTASAAPAHYGSRLAHLAQQQQQQQQQRARTTTCRTSPPTMATSTTADMRKKTTRPISNVSPKASAHSSSTASTSASHVPAQTQQVRRPNNNHHATGAHLTESSSQSPPEALRMRRASHMEVVCDSDISTVSLGSRRSSMSSLRNQYQPTQHPAWLANAGFMRKSKCAACNPKGSAEVHPVQTQGVHHPSHHHHQRSLSRSGSIYDVHQQQQQQQASVHQYTYAVPQPAMQAAAASVVAPSAAPNGNTQTCPHCLSVTPSHRLKAPGSSEAPERKTMKRLEDQREHDPPTTPLPCELEPSPSTRSSSSTSIDSSSVCSSSPKSGTVVMTKTGPTPAATAAAAMAAASAVVTAAAATAITGAKNDGSKRWAELITHCLEHSNKLEALAHDLLGSEQRVCALVERAQQTDESRVNKYAVQISDCESLLQQQRRMLDEMEAMLRKPEITSPPPTPPSAPADTTGDCHSLSSAVVQDRSWGEKVEDSVSQLRWAVSQWVGGSAGTGQIVECTLGPDGQLSIVTVAGTIVTTEARFLPKHLLRQENAENDEKHVYYHHYLVHLTREHRRDGFAPLSSDEWVPDEGTKHCEFVHPDSSQPCETEFDWLVRRHHCRR